MHCPTTCIYILHFLVIKIGCDMRTQKRAFKLNFLHVSIFFVGISKIAKYFHLLIEICQFMIDWNSIFGVVVEFYTLFTVVLMNRKTLKNWHKFLHSANQKDNLWIRQKSMNKITKFCNSEQYNIQLPFLITFHSISLK